MTKAFWAWQNAYEALERSNRMKPNMIGYQQNNLLASLSSSRRWVQATNLFARMRQQTGANVVTLNLLLKASLASWAMAMAILMKSQAMRLQADTVTHSTVIGSCKGQWRPWRCADLLLSSAMRQQLRSNIICESARMRARSARGDWESIMVMLVMMAMVCIETDHISINTAVATCGNAAWQEAQGLVSTKSTFNLETYNTFASACSKDAAWEQSQEFLSQARSKSLRLDAYSRSALLTQGMRRSGTMLTQKWQASLLIYSSLIRLSSRATEISWNAAVDFGEPAGWKQCLDHILKGRHSLLKTMEVTAVNVLSGQWKQAVDFCRRRVLEADSGSCLSRACARLSWTRTLLIYSSLQQNAAGTDHVYWNSLVASSSPRDWQLRLVLVDLMCHAALRADHHTHSSAIAGTEAGAWQQAVCMLQHAVSGGVLANAVVVSAVQVACMQGLNWKRPLAMMQGGARGNAVTCAATIGACGKCDQWELQLGVLSSWALFRLHRDKTLYVDSSCLHTRSWRSVLDVTSDMWCQSLAQDDRSMGVVCAACGVSRNWQLMMFLAQLNIPGSDLAKSSKFVLRESCTIQDGRVLASLQEAAAQESVRRLQSHLAATSLQSRKVCI